MELIMNIHSGPHHAGAQIRNLQEWVHDPYFSKQKLSEPATCPKCGAVYRAGRWVWGSAASDTNRVTCPACQRIQDHCPAGFVTLSGDFLQRHKKEILQLLRNTEQHENAEHPLKRMMALTHQHDGGVEITVTDPHLARAMGEAVRHAYQGQLDLDYQVREYLLRVKWAR
jgi:NMD protein affecting ribosome stability and mRNA decay